MSLDVEILARLQFALTIMFHYLFPPLTIGLGVLMVILEGLYLRTGNKQYEAMARFWTRIFALNFAVGVATGIVMEFQFGTNWAVYSRFVGDVFGPALAAEGIFAFFLESGFLAILVFGWDRVSARMHFFSTIMVALGSMLSAVWIIVANSWQQTPTGYHVVTQKIGEHLFRRAEITDFWAVVFNPSFAHRLTHALLGCFIMGAFFMMSVSAYYILKRRYVAISQKTFTIALGVAAATSLAILFSGHLQACNVYETQPPKLAAFEAHFHTGQSGAPLYLFGMPDTESRTVRYGLAMPGGLSFLLHGDFRKPVTGLDEFPPADWPPVALAFQTYHVMVGLGTFFIALTLFAVLLRLRGTLFQKRWLMMLFVVAVIGPVFANQFGWVAAEVGRQPWIVWGELRISEAYSPSVPAAQVLTSIILFGIIYALLFVAWIFVLSRTIRQGPGPMPPDPASDAGGAVTIPTGGSRRNP